VTRWLVVGDAYVKTAHLANEPGKAPIPVTKLCDLAPRPALPEITDAMILDGAWAVVDRPALALVRRLDRDEAQPTPTHFDRRPRPGAVHRAADQPQPAGSLPRHDVERGDRPDPLARFRCGGATSAT
jgi:hypothetical protein